MVRINTLVQVSLHTRGINELPGALGQLSIPGRNRSPNCQRMKIHNVTVLSCLLLLYHYSIFLLSFLFQFLCSRPDTLASCTKPSQLDESISTTVMTTVCCTNKAVIPAGYSSLSQYQDLPSPSIVVRSPPGRFFPVSTFTTTGKVHPTDATYFSSLILKEQSYFLHRPGNNSCRVPDPYFEDMFLKKLRRAEKISTSLPNVAVPRLWQQRTSSTSVSGHESPRKTFNYKKFAAVPSRQMLLSADDQECPVRYNIQLEANFYLSHHHAATEYAIVFYKRTCKYIWRNMWRYFIPIPCPSSNVVRMIKFMKTCYLIGHSSGKRTAVQWL